MQALPPPPPVTMSTGQAHLFLAAYPLIVQNGVRYRVLGLNLTGSHDALDAARRKLGSEGWSADYMRNRAGTEVLSINTSGKSADQALKMASRLKAHEFGDLDAQLFSLPDLSTAK